MYLVLNLMFDLDLGKGLLASEVYLVVEVLDHLMLIELDLLIVFSVFDVPIMLLDIVILLA